MLSGIRACRMGHFTSHFFRNDRVADGAGCMRRRGCGGRRDLLSLDALDASPAAAMFCSWLFAFGQIVWVRATRTEVHALLLGLEALALGCAIVFARRGRPRWALAAMLFEGLALATHPNALWILPGILTILLARGWFSPRFTAQLLAVSCAPLLLYLSVFLRSVWLSRARIDPTLAIGVPPGQPFWNYGDPFDPSQFVWMIAGLQWNTRPAFWSMLSPLQYTHGLAHFSTFARAEHGWAMLALRLAGLVTLLMRAPAVGMGLALALLGITGFAGAYTIESDQARYLLCALWIEVVFIGSLLASADRGGMPGRLVATFALLLAFGTLWTNRGLLHGHDDPGASAYLARVRTLTGPATRLSRPGCMSHRWVTRGTPTVRWESNPGRRRVPEAATLLRKLVNARPTDIVLEKPVKIQGIELEPLDRGFPGIYRGLNLIARGLIAVKARPMYGYRYLRCRDLP